MGLQDVSLSDRFDLAKSPVLLNGTQALVRLVLAQRARDAAAGLDTAGYVTGYRGSPLGAVDLQMARAGKLLTAGGVTFQPGPERGSRGDGGLGHAAGGAARRGPPRRGVRALVRQGAGRGPLRRRDAAREHGGDEPAWRRHHGDGRRPHGRVVHRVAPVGLGDGGRLHAHRVPGWACRRSWITGTTPGRCRGSRGCGSG